MELEVKQAFESALEIFKTLLASEEVSKSKNKDLYDKYIYDTDVEEALDILTKGLELELYRYNEKLLMCPMVDNRIFGYSNEELKRKIPRINKNDELYLCYFIIMTLITMFYKESAMDTPISYVKFADLVNEVGNKFEALVGVEDIERLSQENSFNFAEVAKVWIKLQDAREYMFAGKNDKVSFVKNVCSFLKDEKLVMMDEDRNSIFPTDRFKAIIYNFFEDRDNKNDLLEFIYGLGGERDASY